MAAELRAASALLMMYCTVAAAAAAAEAEQSSGMSWLENTAQKLEAAFPVRSWPRFALNWRMIAGSILAFLGAMFANSAGVGGGGLFVPMFRLLVGFDVKTSAALSKSTIMGGAIASALYNLPSKHPILDKPLIDYDLALLIQPMLLLGISIGVMCNVMFPDWILTAMLIVVLIGMAYKTCRKGLCTWRAETKQKGKCMHGDVLGRYDSIVNVVPTTQVTDLDESSCRRAVEPSSSLEQGLLEKHKGPSPTPCIKWVNISLLCTVWTAYFILQVLKSHTETCGQLYWILNVLQVPVSLLVTAIGVWRVRRRKNGLSKPENGPGNEQMFFLYPLFAILAGVVGGLLGIGGGMILAPLFLELDIIPQVASATTTFIVVFSSSMSVVEFYLLGRLPVHFALYFSTLCAFSALIGLYATRLFIRKYGRTSFIIFILAFIIGTSAIILGVIGTFADIKKFIAGEYMGFRSLCDR